MKRWGKALAVIVGAFIVFFVILGVFLANSGKSFFERRASLMLGRPVTVDSIAMVFPLTMRLKGLRVEDLLSAARADLNCVFLHWSGSSLHLPRLDVIDAVLTVHRTPDQRIVWLEHDAQQPDQDRQASAVRGQSATAVIDVLSVTNGQIHILSGDNRNETGSLSGVAMTARNVPLSGQPLDATFEISGTIDGPDIPLTGDHVNGKGWLNWPARNMNATVRVVNPQGKLDVEVNLAAKDNDLTVRGHVKTRRMALKSSSRPESSIEDVLLDSMQAAGMELDLDFTFATKLDRWELRNIDFSGNLNASDKGKTHVEKIEDLKNIGRSVQAVEEKLYEKKSSQ